MQKFRDQLLLLTGILLLMTANVMAAPVENIKHKEKCRVCGMFVAKYQPWITQIHYAGNDVAMFDGVKDMMAYYFQPEKFGGKSGSAVEAIYVKDYYDQKWIDGKTATYVTGSDVMGPMGHEFIPFASTEGAENFLKDHNGKKILKFDEITLEQVSAMRSGMMKMKDGLNMQDHDHKMESMKKE